MKKILLLFCAFALAGAPVAAQITIADFEAQGLGTQGYAIAWGNAILSLDWAADPTGQSTGVLKASYDGSQGDTKGAFAQENLDVRWTAEAQGATGIAYDIWIPADFPADAIVKAWGQDRQNWTWNEYQYTIADTELVAGQWNTVVFDIMAAQAANDQFVPAAGLKAGIEIFFGSNAWQGDVYFDNIRLLGIDETWVVDDFENANVGTGSFTKLWGDALTGLNWMADPTARTGGVLEGVFDASLGDTKGALGGEPLIAPGDSGIKAFSIDVFLPADAPANLIVKAFGQDMTNWNWQEHAYTVADSGGVKLGEWNTVSFDIKKRLDEVEGYVLDNGIKAGVEIYFGAGQTWKGSILFDNFTKIGLSKPKGTLQAPANVSAVYDSINSNGDRGGHVMWSDLPDDIGESYNVYYSPTEISDVADPDVVKIASKIPRGVEEWFHVVHTPDGAERTSYYTVTATGLDEEGNLAETPIPGSFGPVTGPSFPAPRIAYLSEGFSDFVLDADLTDFEAVVPEPLKPRYSTGDAAADWNENSEDLNFTLFLIMDNDNLYVGAQIIDDAPLMEGVQNWQEGLDLFIGFYDASKLKEYHTLGALSEAGSGDYRFGWLPNGDFQRDGFVPWDLTDAGMEYVVDALPTGYLIEAKIPFSAMPGLGGETFVPADGMYLPFSVDVNDMDTDDTGRTLQNHIMGLPNERGWLRPGSWGMALVGEPTGTAVDDQPNIPLTTALHRNYPNPFNPATTIQYDLAHPGQVKIQVYNVMGQVIRTLVDANKPAGRYSVSWDGRNDTGRLVGTGTYFLKMQAEEYQKVHKMLFVK